MFKFREKFFELKTNQVSVVEARKGAFVVLRFVWWKLFWWIPWELATTFLMYVPASDYHFKICRIINAKWDGMNADQREAVLAFLRWLDGKGEISKIVDSCKDC